MSLRSSKSLFQNNLPFTCWGDVSPLGVKFVSWCWAKVVVLFSLTAHCLSSPARELLLISAVAASSHSQLWKRHQRWSKVVVFLKQISKWRSCEIKWLYKSEIGDNWIQIYDPEVISPKSHLFFSLVVEVSRSVPGVSGLRSPWMSSGDSPRWKENYDFASRLRILTDIEEP